VSTELTTYDAQPAYTDRQLALIKSAIAPGVDNDQLALFVEVARRTGLDPFSRQIYAVLRNSSEKQSNGKWEPVKKMVIQTGIDGYRAMAARTGELGGIDDATYDNDDADEPKRATVTVYRIVQGQRVPFTATARWKEYAVYKDEYVNDKKTGNKILGDMWAKMPFLMLGKCAEALALRKAFPNEIHGVYTAEEMSQADSSDFQAAPVTVTEADRQLTTEDLRKYAREHRIAEHFVDSGLQKYGGDIGRTLQAMQAAVANRKPATTDTRVTETAPAPEPATSGSMTLSMFTRGIKESYGLTVKQAMEMLGVKALVGINLDTAMLKIDGMIATAKQTPAEREAIQATIDGAGADDNITFTVDTNESAIPPSLETLPVGVRGVRP
jgi:phage recombination protein Bet